MTADHESLKAAILAIADTDKVSPFNGDMVTLFLHEVERLVEATKAAEREACKKLAIKQGTSSGQRISEAIQARGTP